MKPLLNILLVMLLAIANAHSQPANTPIVNSEFTKPNGQKVLLGHCSPSMMQRDIYQSWYDQFYNDYKVDETMVKQLTSLLQDDVVVEIFAGSWCGDTRREIPRLMKILDEAAFDTTQLKLIFVDNSRELYKQSPQHEEAGKHIHRIPTIILYQNGEELNRIVEIPVSSLEEDLLQILSGKPYTSNYYAITYWQRLEGTDQKLTSGQLKDIAASIREFSSNAREFNGYSFALAAQNQTQEAINVLELNTLLYPEDHVSFLSLGKIYQQNGDLKAAVKQYERVLSLQPENAEAQEALAQVQQP